MDLELLKRLRQASQELLQRLRMKQEEIRKGLPSKQLLPASLHGSAAAERWIPLPRRVVCARNSGKQMGLCDRRQLCLWCGVVKETYGHERALRKWYVKYAVC